MSRLSLKPGGEPGCWEWGYVDSRANLITELVRGVPDADLMVIHATINEYLDAKSFAFSDAPVAEKPKKKRGLRWWLVTACLALVPVCVIYLAYSYDERHLPAPASTGGVIDELCMRPGVECSTNIHYVHPPEPR